MAKMLLGAFSDLDHADQAVEELEKVGIGTDTISFITKENNEVKEYRGSRDAGETASDVTGGAVSGATTGGVLGGLAGLLAGAGIFPALAGLFIGGPVAAALGLTGIAATAVSGATTGAAAGGLIGALTGLGVPDATAESYNRTIEGGGIVLGVEAEGDDLETARRIMDDHGATDMIEVNA